MFEAAGVKRLSNCSRDWRDEKGACASFVAVGSVTNCSIFYHAAESLRGFTAISHVAGQHMAER